MYKYIFSCDSFRLEGNLGRRERKYISWKSIYTQYMKVYYHLKLHIIFKDKNLRLKGKHEIHKHYRLMVHKFCFIQPYFTSLIANIK